MYPRNTCARAGTSTSYYVSCGGGKVSIEQFYDNNCTRVRKIYLYDVSSTCSSTDLGLGRGIVGDVVCPPKLEQRLNRLLPATALLEFPFSANSIATSSSGLAVTITSETPETCNWTSTQLNFIKSGECRVIVSQAGNSIYAAASPLTMSTTVIDPTWKIDSEYSDPGCSSVSAVRWYALKLQSYQSCSLVNCTYSSATRSYVSTACPVVAEPAFPVRENWIGYRNYLSRTDCSGIEFIDAYPRCGRNYGLAMSSECALNTTVLRNHYTAACTGLVRLTREYALDVCNRAGQVGFATSQCADRFSQTILLGAFPREMREGSQWYGTVVSSTSQRPVNITILTPSICTVEASRVNAIIPGICQVMLTLDGSSRYFPAENVLINITVTPVSWRVTQYFNSPSCSNESVSYLIAERLSGGCFDSGQCVSLGNGFTYSRSCSVGRPALADGWLGFETMDSQCNVVQRIYAYPRERCAAISANAAYFVTCSESWISIARYNDENCTSGPPSNALYANSNCSGYQRGLPPSSGLACPEKLAQRISVSPTILSYEVATLGDSINVFGESGWGGASSRLPLSVSSETPDVCSLASSSLSFQSLGTCIILIRQLGDTRFAPAPDAFFRINVTEPTWQVWTYFQDATCSAVNATRLLSRRVSSGSSACVAQNCTVDISGRYRVTACEEGVVEPTIPDGWLGYRKYTRSNCTALTDMEAFRRPSSSECEDRTIVQCTANVVQLTYYSSVSCDGNPVRVTSIPRANCSGVLVGFVSSTTVCAEKLGQVITPRFASPTASVGTTLSGLVGTSSSGLSVSSSSQTLSICTIQGSSYIRFLAVGTCRIQLNQEGNDVYTLAPTVTLTIEVTPYPWNVRTWYTSSQCSGTPVFRSGTATSSYCSASSCRYAGSGYYYLTTCEQGRDYPSLPSNFLAYAGFSSSVCANGTQNSFTARPRSICSATSSSVSYRVACFNGAIHEARWSGSSCSYGAASISRYSLAECSTARLGLLSEGDCLDSKFTQTVSLSLPGSSTVQVGNSVSYTATSSMGLDVEVTAGPASVCLNDARNGRITFIGAGVCTIGATQSGSDSVAAAAALTRTFVVRASVLVWTSELYYSSSRCSVGSEIRFVSQRVSQSLCSSSSCLYDSNSRQYVKRRCSFRQPRAPFGWATVREFLPNSARGVQASRACSNGGDLRQVLAYPLGRCASTSTRDSVRARCTSDGLSVTRYSSSRFCSGSATVEVHETSCPSASSQPTAFCPGSAELPTRSWTVTQLRKTCSGPILQVTYQASASNSCTPQSCECSSSDGYCASQECHAGSSPPGIPSDQFALTSYFGVTTCGGSPQGMTGDAPNACVPTPDGGSRRTSCDTNSYSTQEYTTSGCSGVSTSSRSSLESCSTAAIDSWATTSCPRSSTSGSGSPVFVNDSAALIGIIVGCVVGGLLLIAGIIILICCCKRRRQKEDTYLGETPGGPLGVQMSPLGRRLDEEIGADAEAAVLARDVSPSAPAYQPAFAPPPYNAATGAVYSPSAPPLGEVKPNSMYGTMRASEK